MPSPSPLLYYHLRGASALPAPYPPKCTPSPPSRYAPLGLPPLIYGIRGDNIRFQSSKNVRKNYWDSRCLAKWPRLLVSLHVFKGRNIGKQCVTLGLAGELSG